MKKILILPLLFTLEIYSANILKDLQKNGITVKEDGKTINIKPEKNKLCSREYLAPKPLFGGDYAEEEVPTICKKSFVTHVGVLQPMHLIEGVTTGGEVEVLKHIKASQKEPSKYLLVDARTHRWFSQMTINGSWCSQSPNAIMSLVNLGYPTEKLFWYRGGYAGLVNL